MVFPLTRINRMLFRFQIFGFASHPFVNILKFYDVMLSNTVSLVLILWHLPNLPLQPRACLVFVSDPHAHKDVCSPLGELPRYFLVQPQQISLSSLLAFDVSEPSISKSGDLKYPTKFLDLSTSLCSSVRCYSAFFGGPRFLVAYLS